MPWRGFREERDAIVKTWHGVILSPLQGFFFPSHVSKPIIDDYDALFGNLWSVSKLRVACSILPVWSFSTTNPVGSLLVYRINRLYDLLHYAKQFDAAVPNTSFRLQLYIDSFLPLAYRLMHNEPLIESEFTPFLCYEETMMANTTNVIKAFVYTDVSETSRRVQKRQKSAWEVFRRVLSRGIHTSTSNLSGFDIGKPKTFKTMSAEFTDVFMYENDCTIHEVVLCSLLGNYERISDRPPWLTRLAVYSLYIKKESTWLNKCDYVTYYAIRELLHTIVHHVDVLHDAIKSDPDIQSYWNSMRETTCDTMERMRSSLYDISGTKGLKEVNEFLKAKYARNAKQMNVQIVPRDEELLSKALLTMYKYQKTQTFWSTQQSAHVVYSMVKQNMRVSLDCAKEFVSFEVWDAMHHSLCLTDEAEAFLKEIDVTDAMCIRDILKGIFLQQSIRTFRLPNSYVRQLKESLQKDHMRLTFENMQRNTCVYVCSNCFDVMNTVLSSETSAKHRLKYNNAIRIDIQMDGTIQRYCEECCKKRPSTLFPLLEYPLLLDDKTAVGINMLGTSMIVCPSCCLLIKKTELRFKSEYEWCCTLCN